MNREILFRAKKIDGGEWIDGYAVQRYGTWFIYDIKNSDTCRQNNYIVDEDTICRYVNLTDLKGKEIWENDILMCHGNPDDLVKAVFGEFDVIEVESEEVIDSVIGWHYEVIPTDELSKCEPFCYSMPLTNTYVKLNEMEVIGNVFDNPELLKERNGEDAHNSKTGN